ncbi:MAG: isoaspartyl peptidase/L-asparaginase family protein [Acidimicrobiales bacterium]
MRTKKVELGLPAIAIHGGAGVRPSGDDETIRQREVAGLYESIETGWKVLVDGGPSFEAAVAAVTAMENSGVFNAGRGAVPTTAGEVETDAGVMGQVLDHGIWREVAGAACAMTWPANPVHVARAIALRGDALLLAGPGADRFAADSGLNRRDETLLTRGSSMSISKIGTVGAVAVDKEGRLAAATSTGGREGQPPGRVGDTPIIGAGTLAVEGGVAVSATGDGEAFVKAGFAHVIDLGVRRGEPSEEATYAAMALVERWHGTGGAIVLNPEGELVVICNTPAMARAWCSGKGLFAEIMLTDSSKLAGS